jgi:hypothetical protein
MAVTKVAKPITTKAREKTAVRNKKNARMIFRMERNKSKPPAKTDPITVGDNSDSSVERFLAKEGFYGDEPPYDFVDNLPPCLQDNSNILVSSHLWNPVVKHQTLLLLKRVLHPATSVDCG